MNTVFHKADTRGVANHGWLHSHHSFSFASYYNPERMNFGVLRVLNDDLVSPGMGFGTHPHDNMEIISIPLEGDLEHKDSIGNTTVIRQGDIQVMSAGTGISHSEYNKNNNREVKFLQIWIIPDKTDVEPRYDQITVENRRMQNELLQIVSPNASDDGVWIHQDAWFYMGQYDKVQDQTYELNDDENGVYFFVLEGEIIVERQNLNKRDGFGVWNTEKVSFSPADNSKLLLMEVPMSS